MNTIEKYNRLEELKKLVIQKKRLMVEDVVEYFNVSYPTARRYIQEVLTDNRDLKKIRNGIGLVSDIRESEIYFEEKLNINIEAKKAIAKKCASLILEGETIIIDSGSTCYFFAQEIYHKNLKVVSTDIKISMELIDNKNISVYTIGGEIRKGYYSIGGEIAKENIKNFFVNTAIMSADAVDLERGITNADVFEVPVKKELRKCSERLILIVDSSKFNCNSFYHIMPLSNIDIIITDSNIDKDIQKKIKEEKNIELIIV
ncbi:DeoR/GlpR family DNA-binding transcription regulator [uncultured Brachyspira sp.]|uniref:DeoR/GlpR family DNA-binding transcription regulator n=1 Tax=uncultured Brachyspira sp. TaxID=221953 RepID=UPI002623BBD4|nr:DeoR/GlpR family DNA-binding transcription regulator [uncultured Brachyspira sp.]